MTDVKSAAKAVGLIVCIGFFSKILGFIREMVLANYYGATAAMDAYNVAFNIPGVLLAGLAAAITTTFIPVFTQKAEQEGKTVAFDFGRKIITVLFLAGLFICFICLIFAPYLSRLMAPRFNSAQLQTTTELTRILLLTGPFILLNGLCVGLLQSQKRFTLPAFTGIPISLAVITAVILFAKHLSIYALAYGMLAAPLLQVAYQVPGILRTGFPFRPAFSLRDPAISRFIFLILPVFAGTIIHQANSVVDKIFASGLPAGSISALTYANRIFALISGIVVYSIATVSFPTLSRAAANHDLNHMRRTMLTAIRGINFLVLPMIVGLVVLRRPLVKLLFERGAFDAAATNKTVTAMLFLSFGVLAYGIREVFVRVFYSLHDTKTPMINSAIVVTFNTQLSHWES